MTKLPKSFKFLPVNIEAKAHYKMLIRLPCSVCLLC